MLDPNLHPYIFTFGLLAALIALMVIAGTLGDRSKAAKGGGWYVAADNSERRRRVAGARAKLEVAELKARRLGIKAMLPVLAALTLSGCNPARLPPPAAAEHPVPFAVAVATGCVDKVGRPTPPKPLNQRYTAEQWAALPPGSKANAGAAQAGDRMNFEDRDRAATAACK